MAETLRHQLQLIKSQLELERTSFMSQWRDLSDYILPRRARFTTSDVNKGDRRNLKIIDSTASLAARTLRSGMMSGVTSPARPWFRVTTPNSSLNEVPAVKEWLHTVGKEMSTMFLKSNLYNALPVMYGDLGVFGTSAMFVEEDFETVMHFYPLPIGSYCIAQNDRYQIDTLYRELQMTVRQLVQKFGMKNGRSEKDIDWSRFSSNIKTLWASGQREVFIEVCHAVMPNPDFNPSKIESRFKKFLSVYYETGRSKGANPSGYGVGPDEDVYLSISGYDYCPVLAPRWEITGEDVYATECPGMTTIGDIKQLQLGEKRVAQAIDKQINPPMVGPTSLRTAKASILPGDTTFVDTQNGGQKFEPAHMVNFRIDHMESKQAQVRERIRRGFFEDLFLMLSMTDRRDITAREIKERHEEKLLALGPVLEQLNQDLLDPLIDLAFNFMEQQGRLPPAPEELQGSDLKIEYISILAQAQKLVGIGSIERFIGFTGQLAAFKPDIWDKVNAEQAIDEYADMLSLVPSIVNSDEEVEQIRSSRAQAAQSQAQVEQISQLSGAAKNLAGANMDTDSALSRIADQAASGDLEV